MKVVYAFSGFYNLPYRVGIPQRRMQLVEKAADEVFRVSSTFRHREDVSSVVAVHIQNAKLFNPPGYSKVTLRKIYAEIKIDADKFEVDPSTLAKKARNSIHANLLEEGSDIIDGNNLLTLPDFYVSNAFFYEMIDRKFKNLGVLVEREELQQFLDAIVEHAQLNMDYFRDSEDQLVINVKESRIALLNQVLEAAQDRRRGLERLVHLTAT